LLVTGLIAGNGLTATRCVLLRRGQAERAVGPGLLGSQPPECVLKALESSIQIFDVADSLECTAYFSRIWSRA
jgi:hypothetical protein